MSPNETSNGAGSAIHKDYAKSWSPNNTESNIPRWQFGDKYTVFSSSSRFLTNASYLNFQSFTVGYTFPKSGLNLFPNFASMQPVRIFASGLPAKDSIHVILMTETLLFPRILLQEIFRVAFN